MSDRREEILVRIEAVLTSVKAPEMFVYRDRAALEDRELPAYVLLDGNETKLMESSDKRNPLVMELTPQIFFVPVPPENQLNEGVGPNISEHRITLLKAIMNDNVLADLCGSNGYVEYRGMETDMQTGAEVKGQFRLDFAVAYVLDVNKL